MSLILSRLDHILSFETFRWVLVIALVARMFTVSLFNHLTWRKLLSFTISVIVIGAVSVLGISLLDNVLSDVEFRGYPEAFIILISIAFIVGQFLAKMILVANEFGFRRQKSMREIRVRELQERARRFQTTVAPRSILKG